MLQTVRTIFKVEWAEQKAALSSDYNVYIHIVKCCTLLTLTLFEKELTGQAQNKHSCSIFRPAMTARGVWPGEAKYETDKC